MRLWCVTDCECEDGCEGECYWRLVWAQDAAQAEALCRSYEDTGPRLTATPATYDAEFGPLYDKPYLEGRLAVERSAGFQIEGDRRCDSCNGAEMGG